MMHALHFLTRDKIQNSGAYFNSSCVIISNYKMCVMYVHLQLLFLFFDRLLQASLTKYKFKAPAF